MQRITYIVLYTDGTREKIGAKGIRNLADTLSLKGTQAKLWLVLTQSEYKKCEDRVTLLKEKWIPHYDYWNL
jgi:hypothetical protein